MSGRNDPTPPSANNGANPSNSAVAKCPDDPCGKDAISNVIKCCGSEIFDEAKKANGDKDPEIVFGTPSSGFDAETNISTGKITVSSRSNKCTATESVFFELANLAGKSISQKIATDASAGDLSREDYAKAKEKKEYDNVKKTHAAIDKCKEKWGCKSHTFDLDGFRPAKDFNDYYDNYLSESHKNHYRTAWDRKYKGAYDAKHPSPPKK
ncbi:MAG TPA: hypothetical protein PLP22_03810 [Candidatus Competibacter sp.]|nr:hypothetical protein [Candidatus Competibacter sp.]HUM93916.1 hypothetical protein [Candidatus Competibacter sp.]